MITGLLHLHSSFRYLVLFSIAVALFSALSGILQARPFDGLGKISALIALIFTHIQLLVGSLLWFTGAKGLNALMNVEGAMKEPVLRFFAIEHMAVMLIAVTLITIGYSKAKRKSEDSAKHRTVLLFYGIALVLIFIMIPWPFLKDFGTWM